MKFLRSLFITAILTLAFLVGCGGGGNTSSETKFVDYASTLKLDLSSDTAKQEVTVKNYVDGDTTHFNFEIPEDLVGSDEMLGVVDGVLKGRYLGIDTPESTGKVQPWGKAASNFTHDALYNATSIIIESETSKWEKDSTGGRYLVWVWYKNDNATDTKYHDYRLLNLEIMQEGLAFSKNDLTYRYYDVFNNAMNQANSNQLKVWGNEQDPNFFYGAAQEVTLKYLIEKEQENEETGEIETVDRLAEYKDTLIRLEAVIYRMAGQSIYIQQDDPETGRTYGMQCYIGYTTLKGAEVGAKFVIIGTLQYYETGGYYQISGIKSPGLFEIADDESYRVDDVTYETNPVTIDYDEFTSRQEELLFANTRLENLTVIDVYTTNKETSASKGAMTLTCVDENNNEIQVRTEVLKVDGVLVTEEAFMGRTITVVGMVQKYQPENGELQYQFKLFSMRDVTYLD